MRLALLALSTSVAACGLRRVPHYEPVTFEQAEPDDNTRAVVADWVRRDMERGRLPELRIDGRDIEPNELGDVEPGLLLALYGVSKPWARNAELDLWLQEGAQWRPITISFQPSGSAWVERGSLAERTFDERQATASLARVEQRYRLGALLHGTSKWTVQELADASQGLAAVARTDRAQRVLMEDLVIRREALSPRAPGRELAWFDPSTEPPTLFLYDLAFARNAGFVGPVSSPAEPGAMTVAHELGHVLADWPLREAWIDLTSVETTADLKEAKRRWKQFGRRGPVVEAWADVRDGPGPTTYGPRQLHESFAEAFALYQLDPDALLRAMPEAHAWFEDGGHLAAAGLLR